MGTAGILTRSGRMAATGRARLVLTRSPADGCRWQPGAWRIGPRRSSPRRASFNLKLSMRKAKIYAINKFLMTQISSSN
jgi:hypothetical protein